MSETKRATRAFEMRDELEQARAQIARLEAELRKADEAIVEMRCCGNCGKYDKWRDYTSLRMDEGCKVTRLPKTVQSGYDCEHWTARARLKQNSAERQED